MGTRALCDHAGTNTSSIKYHFGSLNAFEQMREVAGADRNIQANLIKTLVDRLPNFFLDSDDIPHFMPFVMREFFSPGPYFEVFYEALPRHIARPILFARAGWQSYTPERIVMISQSVQEMVLRSLALDEGNRPGPTSQAGGPE